MRSRIALTLISPERSRAVMREPAISSGEAPSSSVDLLKSLNQSFHLSTTPSAPLQPGKGLFFSPPTRLTMQLNNRANVRRAVLSQSFLLNSLMVTTHKRSSTLKGSRSQSCFAKDGSVQCSDYIQDVFSFHLHPPRTLDRGATSCEAQA